MSLVRRIRGKLTLPFFLLAPTFFLIFIFAIFPLVYAIGVSTLNYSWLYGWEAARFVGAKNYTDLLTSDFFWKNTMFVTAFIGIGSVSVSLIVALALALAASQEIKGVRAYRLTILIPVLMSVVSVGFLFRYIFEPTIGLANFILKGIGLPPGQYYTAYGESLPTIVAIDIWQWTPFLFLILLAGVNSLPREPFEAADIDGASMWQKFRYLTLPMLRRVIIIAVLLRLMDSLKFVGLIYTVSGGGPAQSTENLAFWIFRKFFVFYDVSQALAASLILLVIVNILSTLFIRQMRR